MRNPIGGVHNMRPHFRRWLRDEAGQDIVEYALLSAFIGLASLAAYSAIITAIGNNYSNSNTSVQGLWNVPDPPGP